MKQPHIEQHVRIHQSTSQKNFYAEIYIFFKSSFHKLLNATHITISLFCVKKFFKNLNNFYFCA